MNKDPKQLIDRLPVKRRYLRWGTWLVVAIFGYAIFLQWQQQFGAPGSSRQQAGQPPQTELPSELRQQAPRQATEPSSPTPQVLDAPEDADRADTDSSSNADTIRVVTDKLALDISLEGGDLVAAWLLDYKREQGNEEPIQLLRNNGKTYIAQNGLVGRDGPDAKTRPRFRAGQSEYRLQGDELKVELVATAGDLELTKIYVFNRDSYLIQVSQEVLNKGGGEASMRPFGQILRGDFEPESHASSGFGIQPYVGAALTTPESTYEKIDYDDMRDADLRVEVQGGWMAMVQHYFLTAWLAQPDEQNVYLTRKARNDKFIMGYVGETRSIAPGEHDRFDARLYIGPKIIARLEPLAPNLDLTVDFGWLWFLASPLFHLLDWFHGKLGNWGVAIILLTLLVKLVFFYPSQLSYRSMAKMRKLAPQMKQLRDSYASDKQKLQQEMMALYKREKVNPLGGCLPILIQMPVFIALYWMLLESVELRHAPFALWITDLTAIDPYFILPLLMGATMLIQQLLSPAPPDPTQAKIMRMLPIVFTFMFLWFPAGLVLYWVTNNTLSILQQWVITRSIK